MPSLRICLLVAKVLDDETRQKVEAQKAKMAMADEAPTITPRETADLMRQLIEILLPGETVTRALKRLRPVKAKGKHDSDKECFALANDFALASMWRRACNARQISLCFTVYE